MCLSALKPLAWRNSRIEKRGKSWHWSSQISIRGVLALSTGFYSWRCHYCRRVTLGDLSMYLRTWIGLLLANLVRNLIAYINLPPRFSAWGCTRTSPLPHLSFPYNRVQILVTWISLVLWRRLSKAFIDIVYSKNRPLVQHGSREYCSSGTRWQPRSVPRSWL